MRYRALLSLLLPLLSGTVSMAAAEQSRPADPAIVAHRGAMSERPQNTMAAFQRALELGADVVEIDVRTSRDGRLVIRHDATVDRNTDGTGRVSDLTFRELRGLDAGSWFDPAYSREIVPSLREVLLWGADRTVLLLDLKERGREFAEAVAAEIRAYGNPEAVVIGVRTPEQAREFREVIPECRQLGFMGQPDLIEEFAEAGVAIIRLWLHREGWLADHPQLAARVREAGAKLMVNGTDGRPEEAEALLAFQPDWILIDDIVRLKESIAALRAADS